MRPLFLTLIALFPLGCRTASPVPAAPPAAVAAPDVAPQPPPKGPERVDSGVFVYRIGGKEIGRETFEVLRTPGGEALRSVTTLQLGGGQVISTGSLEIGLDGAPLGGEFEAKGVAGTTTSLLDRKGDHLSLITHPTAQEAESKGRVDLFLNRNMLVHWRPVCRLAGASKRELSVFPGTSLVLAPVEHSSLEGRSITVFDGQLSHAVQVRVACDGERLLAFRQGVSDLTVVREGQDAAVALVQEKAPEKPALPADVAQDDVKVSVPKSASGGEATLACSLMLPKAGKDNAKLPVAVFITGSGPQNRDEDTVGPGGLKLGVFRAVATSLAQHGVASLRCDDRGTAESSGDFASATLDTFVDDTRAEVAFVRADKRFDPAKVALIGHSEGAVVAPRVAEADPRIAALVLMAGNGRPLQAVILEQQARAMRQAGMGDAELEKELAKSREMFEAIRKGTPLPASVDAENRAVVEKARPWLHSHFVVDPVATVRKLKAIPVFVAQGEKDTQVSLEDADLLEKALKASKNGRAVVKRYPGLNYVFAPTETGDISEYADPNAKVDAGFLADVADFLQKALR